MPMLTTLRIGLPVCPFHSPERTRSANAAIRSSTSCTSATTSTPSTTSEVALRHPQRDVQHRAVLGDVDPLAAEHRLDPLAQPGLPRPAAEQQPERLVGDAVLRVVEVEPGGLGDQPLAAARVGGEQLAQVAGADLLVVLAEGAPGGAIGERHDSGLDRAHLCSSAVEGITR